ncbi:MAG: glycosyl transferase [Acidobacteriota bacterium]|nr:glycosyl transferase [Acidobacteriota bacterium]
MQSMFRRVDADVYVMVDGDATYPPTAVRDLIAPVLACEADMVVGSRWHRESRSQAKLLHRACNRFLRIVVNALFGAGTTDVLSGYRAIGRSFVESISLSAGGFEVETELTIKAILGGYRTTELPVSVCERPKGSHSKIRFFRDGVLMLRTLSGLLRVHRPLTFYSLAGLILICCGLVAATLVLFRYPGAGAPPLSPTVIMSAAMVSAGLLSAAFGITLHTVGHRPTSLVGQTSRKGHGSAP